MMYYLAYNPSLGNAIVGITDSVIPEQDGIVVIQSDEDMPDLSRFTWNSATLSFYPRYRPTLSKKDFLKRFTPAEYGTVLQAAAANSTVAYYWQLFVLAEDIIMDDPDTVSGVQMLEQAGLIAPGRANEIIGI